MEQGQAKDDILRRLKSVEGHVRGIQRMVEEGQYCIDIIQQSLAVQAALDRVNARILERHLQTCVTTAIRSEDPDERERVIGELLQVFRGQSNLAAARSGVASDLNGSDTKAACHHRPRREA